MSTDKEYELKRRIEENKAEIDGKTDVALAELLGLLTAGQAELRYVGRVLRELGYEKRQTTKDRQIIRVWRAPIDLVFISDDEDYVI